MEEVVGGMEFESNTKKLQNLAIQVDKIMREEMTRAQMTCSLAEAQINRIKTVGVQGDSRSYGHPAEITLQEPKHQDESFYTQNELYDFLENLRTRITNEVQGVNRVVWVTAAKD